MMKSRWLTIVIGVLLLLFASSCGNDADEQDDTPSITFSDIEMDSKAVGVGQSEMLTVIYAINGNEVNYGAQWYDGDKMIGYSQYSGDSIEWKPTEEGDHVIKAVVRTESGTAETTRIINVVKCDLEKGLIGDPATKIIRTLGVTYNDYKKYRQTNNRTITIKQGNKETEYFFTNDILSSIDHVLDMSVGYDDVSLSLVLEGFRSRYVKATEKYGQPTVENYTQLEESYEKLIEYGRSICNFKLSVWASFRTSTNHTYQVSVSGSSKYYGCQYREYVY